MTEKYDDIGIDYNLTRQADPYISKRLYYYLQPKRNQHHLDIGCGTGNYTNVLRKKGLKIIGVDPSIEMLTKALTENPDGTWIQGKSEDIPLQKNSIDACLASLTIHHWNDINQGFNEIERVLKPKGTFVLFTSTPKQMKGYWLNHYFPKMLKDSMLQMPTFEHIEMALIQNGFKNIETEAYFVKPDLKDLFLYAGKDRPDLYLNPKVRQSISSFSDLAHIDEVQQGLKQLKQDISSGKIDSIKDSYKNSDGDYQFVVAST